MRWIREHKLFSTVVAIVIVLILIIVGSYASGGGSSFISSGFRIIHELHFRQSEVSG